MSDLKETDEPVEKAGKVTFRGKRMSRAARRKLATGAAPARAIPRHASAIRFAHRLRKSADPLAAFDAAIEKARGLLPRGGSSKLARNLDLRRRKGDLKASVNEGKNRQAARAIDYLRGRTKGSFALPHKGPRTSLYRNTYGRRAGKYK